MECGDQASKHIYSTIVIKHGNRGVFHIPSSSDPLEQFEARNVEIN
jgi:hypothetical protein